MSSTRDRLRAFYAEELVPVAAALRKRGASLLPAAPDGAPSWYDPAPSVPDIVEFEPDEFGSELAAMWHAQGNPELAAVAARLSLLSRELEQGVEQREDVSPFMYVMF